MRAQHKPPLLQAARCTLRMGRRSDVTSVLRYVTANRQHLQPWEPLHPPAFYTAAYWERQLHKAAADFRDGRSLRMFLFCGDEVIGVANFNEIVRGHLQACYLGYSLDHARQGQGIMTEALEVALRHVFDELNLHRVMAAYMPENTRSANVLHRLGFIQEGRAPDYLLINGEWRDHILTSLTNSNWRNTLR